MAWALLKRDIEPQAAEPECASSPSPTLSPKVARKRRTKSFPIVLLYRESEPEPQDQAEALLSEIRKYAEHAIGSYVPATHLKRYYGQLCQERGWEERDWSVIGYELAKLTERIIKKRGRKRFMAYRIPRL